VTRRSPPLVASLALASLLFARTAGAQAVIRNRPERVYLAVDATTMVLAAGGWASSQLALDRLVSPSCPCTSLGLLPVDRWLAGRRDDALALTADISLGVGLVGFAAFAALDAHRTQHDWSEVGEDLVVVAESVLLSGAINQVVKLGVQRPRPMIYELGPGDPALRVADNYLSFYSMHTSTAFSTATSVASVFARRHPNSPWRWAVASGAITFGAGIGLLRVFSGRHFPTDVLTGAVVGSVIGLVLPALHARPDALGVTVGAVGDGTTGVVVAGAW